MSPRRVTVVASELLGRAGTGGAGTADSLLAVALGRQGHDVELLIASGRHIGELSAEWTQAYDEAGVRIRVLERLRGVRPDYLAPTLEVFHALRERTPDVAIVNDWRGLGYAALRSRQLGRAFESTAFVVHCHGPGRVLAEFAQKVPDTVERFGEEITERASVELADAVVSPSEWLLAWMRAHDWPVPESAQVIQYIRQPAETRAAPGELRRLAFFGQLREGKGIRIFLAALDQLDPIEVVFLGSESKRWTKEAIAARVPTARVETALTREAALQELLQPGTLAVMPSLLDNSPNTVSECIEHGIPFISTDTGGIAELVAEDDRSRVLCEPNAGALAERLRFALQEAGFAPARAARPPQEGLDAWLQLIEAVTPSARPQGRRPLQVSVVAAGEQSAARAHALATATRSVDVEVVEAGSRESGLKRTAGDWVVFLEDDDIPDEGFLDALVDAQVASQADVVTAAVRPSDDPTGIQLFLGDPRSLGLIENRYGVVGLVRSELAAAETLGAEGPDPDWLLFARLALGGARVVSIPEPLSEHAGRPGRVGDVPGQGLAVLEAFEQARARPDLPQLGAALAAAARHSAASPADSDGTAPVKQRLRPARFVAWARSWVG
jgi:glycosyltransferase involved in cell wall biosynthesis